MSTQRINLTTATPTHPGRISTIKLVSQAVTGPPGADGAGVSVALKEGGTTKVAVATVLDFTAADFDVTTGGVVSLAVTPQPLDSDLTAIAALSTTSFGRGLLALADAAALLAAAGAATAAQGATADAALPRTAGGAGVTNLGSVTSNCETANVATTKTVDVSTYNAFDLTMTAATTFTFSNWATSGKMGMFTMILRGAYTPTFPAAVKWSGGSAPTYTTPALYVFTSIDAGTTILGAQVGKAFA